MKDFMKCFGENLGYYTSDGFDVGAYAKIIEEFPGWESITKV